MKKLFLLVFFSFFAFSYDVQEEDCRCQTQLLRVEIAPDALNGTATADKPGGSLGLASLQAFMGTEGFKTGFLGTYPLEPLGFPHNKDLCEQEKRQGDPNFRTVDCNNPDMCMDPSVPEGAKQEICYSVPCSLVMSDYTQCSSKDNARLGKINFPEPLTLSKLEMTPLSFSYENKIIRSCFNMTHLDISLAVEIGFVPDPKVNYQNLGLENLNVKLDSPRQVCVTARFDPTLVPPLTQVKIERTGGVFVSDAMMNQAAAAAKIRGMEGVPQSTLDTLKVTVMPAMARHFRSSVENAIEETLGRKFEEQIKSVLGNNPTEGQRRVGTAPNSFMSELGIANFSIKKYVDLIDCSLMKKAKQRIPADHECKKADYPFGGETLSDKDIPKPEKAAEILRTQMKNMEHVTSESVKERLIEFEERFKQAGLRSSYDKDIRPVVDTIANNQLKPALSGGIALMSGLSGEQNPNLGFGVALPDICDESTPSPHAGRSIPNCPVQTYIDLNELNRLLDRMFHSGQLCHRGRGQFVPKLDGNGQPTYVDGYPQGAGCLFVMEEKKGGLQCFMNGAPSFHYDPSTQNYEVKLKTIKCYRGGVFLGQGKIGGDINFDIKFRPQICDGGDFCLEDVSANWNVVPGTERYGLREGSFLNGIIKSKIDKNIKKMIQDSIRIPMSGSSGPLANVPLEAEGRIDKGEGFFGACLRPKASAR